MQTRTVRAGGESIDFIFDVKRIKNINLRVRKDGSVYVSAGYGVPVARVDAFVTEKADWIARRRAEIAARSAAVEATRIADGSETLFLGRTYTVRAVRGKRGVRLDDEHGTIEVSLARPDDGDGLSAVFSAWLDARAKEILPAVFRAAERETQRYFGEPCSLALRRMRARWGSCRASDRKITLNTALVRAPQECIRYVCLHELTHLRCPRHDGDFYAVLSRFCPDCRHLRRRLNALVAPYIGK